MGEPDSQLRVSLRRVKMTMPEGTGAYLDRVWAMYALPELGCQNGLQERTAQADADDLPGRPEQVRDCDRSRACQ